jgi:hypothetical protein
MAATIRTSGANAVGTTSATPGLPTGTVDGDLLVCIAASAGAAGEPTMVTGWNKIRTVKNGTALTDSMLTVWWHTGNATTISRVISSTTNHVSARIIGIEAGTFNSTTPIHVESGGNVQGSTTSVSITGLTTTLDDCLILSISGASLPDANSTSQFASWTNASLASITEVTDNNTNQGNGGGHGSAGGVKTTAGVVSATTVTKVDAALMANLMVAVAPSVAPTQQTLTHTTDSYLYSQTAKTHTTDSLLNETIAKTHTTDAYLTVPVTTVTADHTSDSYLYAQNTKSHTTDSYLEASSSQYTLNHSTDSFLRATKTATHTTDSTLKKTHTTSHTTDTALKVTSTLAHTSDAYLKKTATAAHSTDAALWGSATTSHTTDAYLIGGAQTVSHGTDTLLASITKPKKLTFDVKTGQLVYRVSNSVSLTL